MGPTLRVLLQKQIKTKMKIIKSGKLITSSQDRNTHNMKNKTKFAEKDSKTFNKDGKLMILFRCKIENAKL